ncbi:MAG: carbohydrate binding family 9 domain-containing protein [Planctomycetes bacterium]|nr:carbohydrate binding family 9 domain-containing protein [Planctomycetota bacterium]
MPMLLALFALHGIAKETPTLHVPRLAEGVARPTIDGDLDDPAWKFAAVLDDLRQSEPTAGELASERTEVRIVYDADSFFLSMRCFDREPHLIRDTQMKRDANLDPDDRVEILLDTFCDRRNAFWFQIGAAGSLGDALVAKNGGSFNKQWDGIWYGEARITDAGWQAELEIPMATLNFDPAGTKWGFNLRRHIRRRGEEARWASPDPNVEFFWLANAGTLEGFHDLRQGLGLDVTPFVGAQYRRDDGDSDLLGDAGLDLFYKLTPSTKLALTLHTDFAETEVDERVVNLSRFPLFFPEKRDFFLEDSGVFHFGPSSDSHASSDVIPFFSRRIGIDGAGAEVPLLGAVKVTGRSDGLSFGVLDAATDATSSVDDANLFVGRVSKNVLEQSDIGAIWTSGDPDGTGSADTFGFDANWRTDDFLGDDNLRVASYWLRSDASAVDSADAYHLSVDYPQDEVALQAGATVVEDGFAPQLGFVPRTGIKKYTSQAFYTPRPHSWIRKLDFGVASTLVTDDANATKSVLIDVRPLGVELESGDEFDVRLLHFREVLDADFDIQDDVSIPAAGYTFERAGLFVTTSDKRPVDLDGALIVGDFYDGTREDLELDVNWRPSRWSTFGLGYERNAISLPGGDFAVHVARVRANWQFTPRVAWSNFVQYDNESDELGLNSRLWWILRPGSEFFFVVNQGWDADPDWRFAPRSTQVAFKVGYTLRF